MVYVLRHCPRRRPSRRLAAGFYFISYSLVFTLLRVCLSKCHVSLRLKFASVPVLWLLPSRSRGRRGAPEDTQKLDAWMAGMDLTLSSRDPGNARAEKYLRAEELKTRREGASPCEWQHAGAVLGAHSSLRGKATRCGLLGAEGSSTGYGKGYVENLFEDRNDQYTPTERKPPCRSIHQPLHSSASIPPPLPPPAPTPFLPLKQGHCEWPENTGILSKAQQFLQERAGTAASEPGSPLHHPQGDPDVLPSPLFIYFSSTPVELQAKFLLLRWHKTDPGFPRMCRRKARRSLIFICESGINVW
ncbi:methylated-DNA--protein-cysteine methyltransferase isoform X2 [Rissa tridactyla]|uniref:methylated-DNA--protein-cysteine methyltransferase isoform X2 n=1 Tax=Rissa tridactyla TaxID=75485 RepID=UPI0023BAD97B|nr:methylated-DNA--protein-cysteine methyltransferase isoform X2 [Rissa tridactyla]